MKGDAAFASDSPVSSPWAGLSRVLSSGSSGLLERLSTLHADFNIAFHSPRVESESRSGQNLSDDDSHIIVPGFDNEDSGALLQPPSFEGIDFRAPSTCELTDVTSNLQAGMLLPGTLSRNSSALDMVVPIVSTDGTEERREDWLSRICDDEESDQSAWQRCENNRMPHCMQAANKQDTFGIVDSMIDSDSPCPEESGHGLAALFADELSWKRQSCGIEDDSNSNLQGMHQFDKAQDCSCHGHLQDAMENET